ncbi:MAG: 2-aminoethylphosphonate--pyruvate transaminase [Alphaproteobacteria bacterium]|nr:2-aminoethylphosphonate--pyruvate transaminase [Alphaproteobacteria bacterium]
MPPVPLLLTPGPLTTSDTVKEAMLRDWGSRDPDFIAMNSGILERLCGIVNAGLTHVAVPIQGSGTFAVEAMIGTLLPRSGAKLLVLVNGAYGHRMVKMAHILGRPVEMMEWPEDAPVSPQKVDARLGQDASITHVAVVQCETTSGILNPIEEIADVVRKQRRALFIDAMSAFGALPLDLEKTPFLALAASSNKCLEGVPGLGFVIAQREMLKASKGNAHSLALDLHDQWQGFQANGQWRFTPPTHVVAALAQALDEFDAEGGVAGRGKRYRDNLRVLVSGMRAMGFQPLLPEAVQAPIIVTFRMPSDPAFDFQAFYRGMAGRGFLIYPGKLTVADSFRMGCIGRLTAADMQAAIEAVKSTLAELGVASGAP